MSYCVVFTTLPHLKEARKLSRKLLQKKLAACISIISGVESHYWWKGKKEKGRECLLLIKTARRAYSRLEKAIHENHPYTLPEIISVPLAKGYTPYLRWISGEVET